MKFDAHGRLTLAHRTWRAALPLLAVALLSACAQQAGLMAPERADGPDAAAPPAAAAASAPAAAASAQAASAPAPAGPAASQVAVAAPPVEPSGPPPQPVDSLNPDIRIDPDDYSVQVDLWQRIRDGYSMQLLDNELVRKWEQYYAERPDYMQRMTERGSRYLFHVVEEVAQRGLPMELALLPFVESAFNPQAMSSASASGMWQFIPSTGRAYQLTQNVFRDDRRDVLASTRAALDYLQSLHDMFGDWHHALAAYNWGQGSVRRAIARNQQSGRPTDYDNLKMPAETRNYVPKLMAIRNLIGQPANFGLQLPVLHNHPYFLSVPIDRDIDVALASRLADLPVDEFRQLNPQLNRPVILAAGTPQVLLPYDNANAFVRNLGQHRGQLASWTAWVAPRTMKTAEAAKQVGMDEPTFREVNGIPPRMLVKAGSTLLVPRSEQRVADVSEHIADNAVLSLAPESPAMRRVKVRAPRRGATVAAIARQYRMGVDQLAALNGVSARGSFRPGQTIVVLRPVRGNVASTGQGKGKRAVAPPSRTAKSKGGPPRSAKRASGKKRAVAKSTSSVRNTSARVAAGR